MHTERGKDRQPERHKRRLYIMSCRERKGHRERERKRESETETNCSFSILIIAIF